MEQSRRFVPVLVACVAAATFLSVASANPAETRQRIAIVVRANFAGSGTFELISLSPGPLQRDSGKVTSNGSHNGTRIRGGQRVTLISGTDALRGKQGTLRVTQSIETAEVGDGHEVITGTWSLDIYTTTGAYKGFVGGGRLSGIEFRKTNRLIIRQEGFVTKSF